MKNVIKRTPPSRKEKAMSEMQELKPLPCWHCEMADTITTELDALTGYKWGYAACSCGARGPDVRTGYDGGSQAAWRVEAITAWNTRPTEDRLVGALEEAERALEELVATVRGECPRLLSEDSGGNASLSEQVDAALTRIRAAKGGE